MCRSSTAPLFLVSLCAALLLGASHPPLETKEGVVSADNALASEIGAEVLASGGNAADAAVAVALSLGVLHPFASGLGGGGFCLYFEAESGEVTSYDFREKAPALAHANLFVEDPNLAREGALAVGVPGEIAGLSKLHLDHGRREWSKNFSVPISLARYGAPASKLLVKRIKRYREKIEANTELAAWLLPEGALPREQALLQNPALANTLELLAAKGPDAFYQGNIAQTLVEVISAKGGILSLEDLNNYEVRTRAPIQWTFDELSFYGMAPPSSGGTTLATAFGILAPFPLSELGHNSSAYLHLLSEGLRFAFADRANYLGDGDFVEIPEGLFAEERLAPLREKIDPEEALPKAHFGDLIVPDDAGTSHFSILDEEGNAAACTTTINTGFGAWVYAKDLGLILNNEMDDFVAKPGTPNAFGLVGSNANAVEAEKRPLSSMSPTIALRDGEVALVIGGSGGPTILSSVLQVSLNLLRFDMTASEAVDASRIHHQWIPDQLKVEEDLPLDVIENLESRGHQVVASPAYSAVQLIWVREDGTREAAADPRKGGLPHADSP